MLSSWDILNGLIQTTLCVRIWKAQLMCTTEWNWSYSWAKENHDEYLMLYIKVFILSTCSDPVVKDPKKKKKKCINITHLQKWKADQSAEACKMSGAEGWNWRVWQRKVRNQVVTSWSSDVSSHCCLTTRCEQERLCAAVFAPAIAALSQCLRGVFTANECDSHTAGALLHCVTLLQSDIFRQSHD